MRIRGTVNKQSQFMTENLVYRQFVLAGISNNAKRKKTVKRIKNVLNRLVSNCLCEIVW